MAEYPLEEWAANIRRAYQNADTAQTARGAAWYADYGRRMREGAAERGFDAERAAAIVGVSSINTRPEPGLRWSLATMAGATGGHLPIACERAAAIMALPRGEFEAARDIACPPTSPSRKVRSFACNILTGGDKCEHAEACVTIDRWAHYIATDGKAKDVPTGRKYDALARAYRMVADEFGISPAIVQAVTWVTVAE